MIFWSLPGQMNMPPALRIRVAYLSSSIAYELLQYASVQVSGGQLDLSNKYLNNLPIPNLEKLGSKELASLVRFGTKISEGTLDRWADLDAAILSALNN